MTNTKDRNKADGSESPWFGRLRSSSSSPSSPHKATAVGPAMSSASTSLTVTRQRQTRVSGSKHDDVLSSSKTSGRKNKLRVSSRRPRNEDKQRGKEEDARSDDDDDDYDYGDDYGDDNDTGDDHDDRSEGEERGSSDEHQSHDTDADSSSIVNAMIDPSLAHSWNEHQLLATVTAPASSLIPAIRDGHGMRRRWAMVPGSRNSGHSSSQRWILCSCWLPLILLLFAVVVPTTVLRIATALYGPIPVAAAGPLVGAYEDVHTILRLTEDEWLPRDTKEPYWSPGPKAGSLRTFIDYGKTGRDICDRVRHRWQRAWEQKRLEETGPCFDPWFAARREQRQEEEEGARYYHPEENHQGDHEDKDDVEEEGHDSVVALSAGCQQEMQIYAILGLDIAEMNELVRACKPWTWRSLQRARDQVSLIHLVAKSTTKDLRKVTEKLWQDANAMQLDVKGFSERWSELSPEGKSSISSDTQRFVLASLLGALNQMTVYLQADGDAIYYDELEVADASFYSRRDSSGGSNGDRDDASSRKAWKRYARKNPLSLRRAQGGWERYPIGSLLHMQGTVENATTAAALFRSLMPPAITTKASDDTTTIARPSLHKSIHAILVQCERDPSGGVGWEHWSDICRPARMHLQATQQGDPGGEAAANETCVAAKRWQTIEAASRRLVATLETLDSLRCGLGLVTDMFAEHTDEGWAWERQFVGGSPRYADSAYERLALDSHDIDGDAMRNGRGVLGGRLVKILRDGGGEGGEYREVGRAERRWQECGAVSVWGHLLAALVGTGHVSEKTDVPTTAAPFSSSSPSSPSSSSWTWRVLWEWLAIITGLRKQYPGCYWCWRWRLWLWPRVEDLVVVVPVSIEDVDAWERFWDDLSSKIIH